MTNSLRLALASLLSIGAVAACGPAQEGSPTPSQACPDTSLNAPTEHPLTLAQSETWTAAASPHLVSGDTRLNADVTLTIEPCARVVFAEGASLSAARGGARIVAEGEAARPISFSGLDGARWNQVKVEGAARGSLRYVTLSGGGGDRFYRHASLVLRGTGATPAAPVALLDHVTITDSMGPGVMVDRAGTFAPGSTDLTVTRSGGEVEPFAMIIGEHAIDGVPTGAYTGNRVDEILVDPEGANQRGGLQEDTTMRDRGVPYRIGDSDVDRFNIGAGGADAGRVTTLTVEPGVVMRFHPHGRLGVEHYTGEFAASGVLRAVGTAERPVVMTSAAEHPQPGDWVGIWYGGVPSAQNRLEHVTLEYTGDDCGCVLLTCSDITADESAVIFTQAPPTNFIHDVRFVRGSGHGVFRGWRGPATPDFSEGNAFEQMSGCAQTLPALPDGCTPLVACR